MNKKNLVHSKAFKLGAVLVVISLLGGLLAITSSVGGNFRAAVLSDGGVMGGSFQDISYINSSKDSAMNESMNMNNVMGGAMGGGMAGVTGEMAPSAPEPAPDMALDMESTDQGIAPPEILPPIPGGKADVFNEDKLVYTANLNLETTEFDKAVLDIKAEVTKNGGIIQSTTLDSYGGYQIQINPDNTLTRASRAMNIQLRIPTSKFETFMEYTESICSVINKSTNVENISQSYYDTQSRLKSLRVQEARLLEMVKKATTVEDMLKIEAQLGTVQTEIDSSLTSINHMDMDVAFSTITINLQETAKYTEKPKIDTTFSAVVGIAFKESLDSFKDDLEGIVIGLIMLLPYILILGVVVTVIVVLVKRRTKTRAEKAVDSDIKDTSSLDILEPEESIRCPDENKSEADGKSGEPSDKIE